MYHFSLFLVICFTNLNIIFKGPLMLYAIPLHLEYYRFRTMSFKVLPIIINFRIPTTKLSPLYPIIIVNMIFLHHTIFFEVLKFKHSFIPIDFFISMNFYLMGFPPKYQSFSFHNPISNIFILIASLSTYSTHIYLAFLLILI
jgi:hypothetical protein